ncbi:hypothetical protein SDC9_82019 [bioreactor metagenome]|uniref:Uncharacterized protein n=1 Tax=bioreactor metagenome TaxID=1076179 RepID=A0A644Z484_9ZZZZ
MLNGHVQDRVAFARIPAAKKELRPRLIGHPAPNKLINLILHCGVSDKTDVVDQVGHGLADIGIVDALSVPVFQVIGDQNVDAEAFLRHTALHPTVSIGFQHLLKALSSGRKSYSDFF